MKIYLDDDYHIDIGYNLLGYVGEHESRTVELVGYAVDGANAYRLRLCYSDGVTYDVDINDGSCVIQSSLLRKHGTVQGQLLALYIDGDNCTFVKKSNIFDLVVGESLGDDTEPIPTPEISVDALAKIQQSENNAKLSEENAKESETQAKASETNAKTSETNAKASETNAKESENVIIAKTQEIAQIAESIPADYTSLSDSVDELKGDLGDIRKVSPNIFDKTKAIIGKRPDGMVYGQYTDYPSRSAYSIKFDSIITQNCKILFNQKPGEIIYYKEKNGVYERLGAYTTPQEDENGNYYYQISGITDTRWLSAIEISYTTKNTNVDTFMMCIDSLPDGYIPFGIYLESFEKRVATEKDIYELKENKVITDTVTGFGVGALAEESDSKYNVGVGVNALRKAKHTEENDTGYYNVAVGHNALPVLETGSHNTAVGFQALNKNVSGHYNTACGEDTLFNTTGNGNTGCGCRALQNNTAGTNNTAVGVSALYNCTTGYMNNAVGSQAGNSVTTDTRCNFFGRDADKNTSDIIDNSMALGHSAKVTKSNQVVIGNSSVEEFIFGNKKIIFNSDGTVLWEIMN